MNIPEVLFSSGFVSACLALAVAGVTYVAAMIKNRTEQLNSEVKDKNLNRAMTTAENAISSVVTSLFQNVVIDLKAKASDGKLTAADAEEIKNDAIAQSKQLIGTTGIAALKEIYGDVDSFIGTKVDAYVLLIKKQLGLDSASISASVSETSHSAQ